MTQAYTILIYAISYLLFFGLLWLSKKKKGYRLMDENGPVENLRMIIVLHIGGFLSFGILPFSFSDHSLADILFARNTTDIFQTVTITVLVVLLLVIAPTFAQKNYRGNRSVSSSLAKSFIAGYFLVRIPFLFSYEMWFRGFLLTDSINNLGIAIAIFLNICLYALLHAVNGKKEMLACLPFGLLLCGLCIWAGAAWPAIVLHLALTMSYEIHLVKKINTSSTTFV